MKSLARFRLRIVLAGLCTVAALRAESVERAEIEALRAQVRQLERQLAALAEKIEGREASRAAAPAASRPAHARATDREFGLASEDDANAIRLRGLVQVDNRLFLDDADGQVNDGIVLRRARINTEGTFARHYGFQLVTEFAGSSVSILDANVTIGLTETAQLKLGKFKVPVGLEQLQSDTWTFFNERSLVTNLVPNRDLGIQLGGELLGQRLDYAVGVFNGVGDGRSTGNADFDEQKDVVGRLFFTPFRDEAESSLRGLGFGIAASVGRESGTGGRTSGYRSDGQQRFFAYEPGVSAEGQNWRVSPQFDFRRGALGILGEYVLSTANLRPAPGGPKSELQNHGWQLAAGYVLTGEASGFGGVVPRTNFDLAAGTWGAFELVGRYATLDVDDAAFPIFASPADSATQATSLGLGLNWYLAKAAMLKLDYYQTDFELAPGAPATPANAVLRQDEKAFITRLQVSF